MIRGNYIVAVFVCLGCFVLAQDEWGTETAPTVEGLGKSMDKETAFRLACQNALKAYLQNIFPPETIQQSEKEIDRYLSLTYKRYFVIKPEIKLWDGWMMKIEGRLKKDRLAAEIRYLIAIPDIKGKLTILEWDETLNKIPPLYADTLKKIVQTSFEDSLKRYGMEFTTPEKIQKELERETRESGTFSGSQETTYLESSRNHFRIRLGLMVHQIAKEIGAKPMYYWDVKLAVEIFPEREKNRIYNGIFPPANADYGIRLVQSHDEARLICEQLVAKVSSKAVETIATYLRDYRPAPKSRYTIYFCGFNKSQKLKIISAFEHLLARQKIQEIQRGPGGGDTLKIVVESDKKINVLQDTVTTYCLEAGVEVMLDPSRQDDLGQVFYFVPREKFGDW